MSARGQKGQQQAAKSAADKAKAAAAAEAKATRAAQAQANRTVQAMERLAAARSRNGNAFAGRQSLLNMDKKDEATLRKMLPELRQALTEHGVIIRKGSGDVLVNRVSSKVGTIQLSGKAKAGQLNERQLANGNIWIHNHPSEGKETFPTFSQEDFQDNRGRLKPDTAVVVSKGGIALWQPRKDGTWPAYASEWKPAIDRAYKAYDTALRSAAYHAKLTGNKAMAKQLSNLTWGDVMHMATRDVSRQMGMKYLYTQGKAATAGKRAVSSALSGLGSKRGSTKPVTTGTEHQMSLMGRYFNRIMGIDQGGHKTVEGRAAGVGASKVRSGDIIRFTDKKSGQSIRVQVGGVRRYASAADMVRAEGAQALGARPGTKAGQRDIADPTRVVNNYNKLLFRNKDKGMIAYDITYLP